MSKPITKGEPIGTRLPLAVDAKFRERAEKDKLTASALAEKLITQALTLTAQQAKARSRVQEYQQAGTDRQVKEPASTLEEDEAARQRAAELKVANCKHPSNKRRNTGPVVFCDACGGVKRQGEWAVPS